jgi:hypothetical protein
MKVTILANPEARGKSYWWNLGEALSQVLAALVGLNANLTFSAYCGYWKEKNYPVLRSFHKPINWLFRDPEHCQNAWGNVV